ncbi:MAG: methyl-accepting chemotaxis protein [Ruminococcus sp.]|jgi:methyl-accepting chemotaxis protein|nr:methyl-accepting chemotaxis protein [Ruminococcus sp.]
MKNMKIGKKLLVGFGIPIGLMVLIVILVMTLNLITINDIKTVSVQTDIWDYAVDARGSFMNARVQSNQLIYGYQESLHTAAVGYIDETEKYMKDGETYLKANLDVLSDLQDDAQSAAEGVTAYRSALEDMTAALKESDVAKAATKESGSQIQAQIDELFDGQMSSLNNDFDNYAGAAAGSERNNIRSVRIEKIEGANDLATILTEVRVLVNVNLETFDDESAQEAITEIDDFITSINDYKAILTVQANRDSCDALIETITTYKQHFVEYETANLKADAALAQFRTDAAAATTALNTLADQNDAVNAALAESQNMATISLIAVTALVVIAIIVSVIMAMAITKAIASPIAFVTETLKAIGTRGRTHFSDEEKAMQKELASGKDETAECAENLGNVSNALNAISLILTRVADGDLTIEHNPMSEDDTISSAIVKMIDSLNMMFGEIDRAAEQVSLGANQISDASQSLAEGSTEQAATVQQLSASIQDVAEKTKQNAERAVNASEMSAAVKQNAEKGADQMAQMTEAVSEINQASQDISKVIKVIDDIAFQTNILALNAAVEAARAGEAGKGFAVVADEVRNLASKSAAAAKETGVLIENSMKKAELGSNIAAQTAASLSDIVEGINRSTDLISEIADSSEQQSMAISQINEGITQVSEVVQKNSATAEECAASAEELNAQSSILTDHVSRFHLKNA